MAKAERETPRTEARESQTKEQQNQTQQQQTRPQQQGQQETQAPRQMMHRNQGRRVQDAKPERSIASPVSLLRHMFQDMEGLFSGSASDLTANEDLFFEPKVDVLTRNDELVVRADLPGMKNSDVQIELTDDGLILEGERIDEKREDRQGFYQLEQRYGAFRRYIPLPEGIDPGTANAVMKNGVLEVTFKLPQQARRGRKLEIQEGEGQSVH